MNDYKKSPQKIQTSFENDFIAKNFFCRYYFASSAFRIVHYSLVLISFCLKIYATITSVMDISSPNIALHHIMGLLIHTLFELWFIFIISESFFYPSRKFAIQFDQIWIKLPLSRSLNTLVTIKKRKFRIQLGLSIVAMVNILSVLIVDLIFIKHGSYIVLTERIASIYAITMNALMLQSFLVSGVFIKSGHDQLHHQIIRIQSDCHISDHYMYICRHEHHDLTQLIHLCDQHFRRYVTLACTLLVPNFFAVLFDLIFLKLSFSLIILHFIWLIRLIITFKLLFECIVGFFRAPRQSQKAIYFSSLVERSDKYKMEVLYFMDFINRKSVGIRYMGIFLITPEIIPTLATFIFTYLMAIPNFMALSKSG